jgi:DNA helicase-2/ATP-dependent DNA helicase PcrA
LRRSTRRAGKAAARPILEGLNEEQRRAVETTEGPVLVLAGAGSGKTRVITRRIAFLLSKGAAAQSILAVTFTNKAAREMRSRVAELVGPAVAKELTVSTFHSFCVRLLREHAEAAGLPPRFTICDESDQLTAVKNALRDLRIAEARVHPKAALSRISLLKNRLAGPREALDQAVDDYDELVARAYAAYDERLRRSRAVDFDDLLLLSQRLLHGNADVRRKLQDRYRYLMVDEYQDTNGPQYEILRALAGARRNLCVVGDDDQCLVRGTSVTQADGTTRAIERLRPGDRVLSALGSGRFGPARVTRVFRKSYSGPGVEITLRSGKRLTSTPEHTHFAGYRLGLTPQTYFTYLMHKRGVGFRLGTTQVYTAGQEKPMLGFAQRSVQEHADGVWIVGTHPNENEARADEYIASLRYRIPTLPFVPRRGKGHHGLVHDPRYLARVFKAFNTSDGARRLLSDRGLSLEHPHCSPRSRDSNRRRVVLTLCGDGRGRSSLHRISISGNDAAGRRALESLGLRVRPAKKTSKGWRVESSFRRFEALQDVAARIRTALDASVERVARLGTRRGDGTRGASLPFLPAGSVLPGMAMFASDGTYDIVERVRRIPLKRQVYDLDVEDSHNFIANSVVTHNSIYGWRGADVRKILGFEKDFPGTTVVRLETNYRSTEPILAAANAVIRHNRSRHEKTLKAASGPGEPVRVLDMHDEEHEAEFVVDEIAREVRNGRARYGDFAVLFRTAVQPRTFEARLRSGRIPYELVGGMSFFDRKEVRDVLAYLRLAANPLDEASLLRVVNVPARGVGKTTIDRLLDAATKEGVSAGVVADWPSVPGVSPEAHDSIRRFRRTLAEFGPRACAVGMPQAIREMLLAVRYQDEIDRCYEDAVTRQARWAAVEEVLNLSENYARRAPRGTLEDFLEEVALAGEDEREETDDAAPRDAVTLMTLHSAKGLEFPRVYLVGVEEGLLPHERSIAEDTVEEERRLMYVGITRARRHLTVTRVTSRAKYGRREPCKPSRFIAELRGQPIPKGG